MPLVNGLIVPTFHERAYNARNRAWRAWRGNPRAATYAELARAFAVYRKRYG